MRVVTFTGIAMHLENACLQAQYKASEYLQFNPVEVLHMATDHVHKDDSWFATITLLVKMEVVA